MDPAAKDQKIRRRRLTDSRRRVLRRVRLTMLILPLAVGVLVGVPGMLSVKNDRPEKAINSQSNGKTHSVRSTDDGWSTTMGTTEVGGTGMVKRRILFIEFNCKAKKATNVTSRPAGEDYRHYFDYSEEEVERDESYDDGDDAGNNDGQFPPDFFSLEHRQRGAVLFHMFGLVYMFIALAIVCDEFFVPALTVITETFDISEDVAGATFMAAGGSAPEFFTSVIGVFIAQNNVGIGTIVGSATFNILFVLAFCTLFSTTVLYLTWWPLFRDVFFYIISLMMLLIFFVDEQIEWWEALSLFIVYICYCTFMKYNEVLENWTKSKLPRCGKSAVTLGEEAEQQTPIMPQMSTDLKNLNLERLIRTNLDGVDSAKTIGYHTHEPVKRCESLAGSAKNRNNSLASALGQRRQSIPILHSGAMFRNGIIQLMSQTLESVAEKDGNETSECDTSSVSSPKHNNTNNHVINGHHTLNRTTLVEDRQVDGAPTVRRSAADAERGATPCNSHSPRRSTKTDIEQLKLILEEEEEKPLDMSWPDQWHKRVIYVFLSPILFPLSVTLPDVRKEDNRRWFVFTFCGSIFWIACFSYVMVWFANTIGETFVIPTEIIGLTILAAGTSIPDLITSVIVARKGLGDMAVSSSIGSNIFDVCVGLPVPWLLYFSIQLFRSSVADPIAVSSNGLICSVGMLFLMLIVLVFAIALSGWRMDKAFGVVMIVSYVIFCVISVRLETGHFQCPLRLC